MPLFCFVVHKKKVNCLVNKLDSQYCNVLMPWQGPRNTLYRTCLEFVRLAIVTPHHIRPYAYSKDLCPDLMMRVAREWLFAYHALGHKTSMKSNLKRRTKQCLFFTSFLSYAGRILQNKDVKVAFVALLLCGG